jgi:hypothetical protein
MHGPKGFVDGCASDGPPAIGLRSMLAHLAVTDWIEISVAAGTFLLAVATGYMAWKTRSAAAATERVALATKTLADQAKEEVEAVRKQSEAVAKQAKASERQAEVSAASLEAAIQPWLTRVPLPPYAEIQAAVPSAVIPLTAEQTLSVDAQGDTIKVRFYVRNVGAGLALIQAVGEFRDRFTIEGRDATGASVTRYGFAASPAVPPGESTRLSFLVEHVSIKHFLGQGQSDGLFHVNVPYTDAKGGQLVDARIRIAFSKASKMWLFHRIEYTREGEGAPFVSVEFDAAMWG